MCLRAQEMEYGTAAAEAPEMQLPRYDQGVVCSVVSAHTPD